MFLNTPLEECIAKNFICISAGLLCLAEAKLWQDPLPATAAVGTIKQLEPAIQPTAAVGNVQLFQQLEPAIQPTAKTAIQPTAAVGSSVWLP